MRRTLLSVAAFAALSSTLIACGSDDEASSGGCEPSSTVEVLGNDALQFTEDSYAGEAPCVEFVYRNEGNIAHTLLVRGESGFKLSIGREDTGTVELSPGTYELYCDIAGHEAAGMVAPLEVS